MARRTISLNDGFENAIRKWQTVMMLDQKRDITFTEALHTVLLRGFIGGTAGMAWWKGEPHRLVDKDDIGELMDGYSSTDVGLSGVLDLLPDEVSNATRVRLDSLIASNAARPLADTDREVPVRDKT